MPDWSDSLRLILRRMRGTDMQMTLHQAAGQLMELAQRAAQGERIVADGLHDLTLIALPTNSRKRQAGQLKHAITIQGPHWDQADDALIRITHGM